MVKDPPSSAWGVGSVPGQGAKMPHSPQPEKLKPKKKQCGNKVNKYF